MKKNALYLLALIMVCVSSALAWQQYRQAAALQNRIASLASDLQSKTREARELEDATKRLETENEAYMKESAALREKLAATSHSPALAASDATPSPAPKKNGMADFFGSFMKDPKMKELMRQQHGNALKQMYGEFVKSRGLTAQQSDEFFKLLLDRQLGGMEDGMKVLSGEEKSPNDQSTQTAAERKAENERQMQMLLGDGGYANYQEYEKTIGERMTMSQLQQQFALGSTPLAPEQAKTLLQVMIEERANTPASALTAAGGNPRAQLRALAASGESEQFYQAQADLNQRVLNRAGNILKPDQISALQSFQNQQLEMQKLGLEMAKKMMGNPDGAAAGKQP